MTAAPQPDTAGALAGQNCFLPQTHRSGRGATVVLRVEVLPSGNAGRIAIDVSGGSTQIDAAATECARARRWVPGMIDEKPRPMWIRVGVRVDE